MAWITSRMNAAAAAPARRALPFVALALALAACNPGPEATGGIKRISIATGGTGGVYYPYGGGIAKIISENIAGVEATAEATAASVDNLKFLRDGRSDVAFSMADTAEDAARGQGPFAEFGEVPSRTLAVLYTNYLHLATLAGSGIRSVADLKGRVVSTGAPGSGTEVVAFRTLEAFGLDPQRDLTTQALGASQSVDALKDGKVHAFFFTGGLPTAAVLDLTHSPGITAHLVPSADAIPKMREKYGESMYYPVVIPRSVYSLDADVPVVGIANLLVVSENMPEQLAYDITRLLFEKQADLVAIHPQARDLSLATAVVGSPVPFHPGAIRYYREQNAWKP